MGRLEKVLCPHDVVARKRRKEGLGFELVPERIAVVDIRRARREPGPVEKPPLVEHREARPRRHEAALRALVEILPLPGVHWMRGRPFVVRMKGLRLRRLVPWSATIGTGLRCEPASVHVVAPMAPGRSRGRRRFFVRHRLDLFEMPDPFLLLAFLAPTFPVLVFLGDRDPALEPRMAAFVVAGPVTFARPYRM